MKLEDIKVGDKVEVKVGMLAGKVGTVSGWREGGLVSVSIEENIQTFLLLPSNLKPVGTRTAEPTTERGKLISIARDIRAEAKRYRAETWTLEFRGNRDEQTERMKHARQMRAVAQALGQGNVALARRLTQELDTSVSYPWPESFANLMHRWV